MRAAALSQKIKSIKKVFDKTGLFCYFYKLLKRYTILGKKTNKQTNSKRRLSITSQNLGIYDLMWQRGINVSGEIMVASQLTLT